MKVVIVGDLNVGKSSLLESFTQHTFKAEYSPTVCENYTTKISFTSPQPEVIEVVMWDTSGSTDLSLRTLCYKQASLFVVCFSLVDRNSFLNVLNRWIPEITSYVVGVPVLLVGTKKDLRVGLSFDDMSSKLSGDVLQEVDYVHFAEGKSLARDIGAVGYVECSAQSRDGVEEVFRTAITYYRNSANKFDDIKDKRSLSFLKAKVMKAASPNKRQKPTKTFSNDSCIVM